MHRWSWGSERGRGENIYTPHTHTHIHKPLTKGYKQDEVEFLRMVKKREREKEKRSRSFLCFHSNFFQDFYFFSSTPRSSTSSSSLKATRRRGLVVNSRFGRGWGEGDESFKRTPASLERSQRKQNTIHFFLGCPLGMRSRDEKQNGKERERKDGGKRPHRSSSTNTPLTTCISTLFVFGDCSLCVCRTKMKFASAIEFVWYDGA